MMGRILPAILMMGVVVCGALFALGRNSKILKVFCAFLGLALSTGVLFGFQQPPETKTFKEVYQLAALKDNVNSKGTFFLGTGNVSETDYYYVIIKQGNRMKFRKLTAQNWDVVEIENANKQQPRIEITKRPTNGAFEQLSAMLNEEVGGKEGKIVDQVIYIPKGSITHDYKIDLEK